MEFIGYICAALVGISLGVLGSGGSILTLPIMVYLLGINPVDATGYSLFVVGITSAIGGITYLKRGLVSFKAALVFAAPSIICVFLTRRFLVSRLPDVLISTPAFTLSKEVLILLLFAVLMIIASYNMIRNANLMQPETTGSDKQEYHLLIGVGIITGILTGILGVGGGFIIIPALVLYAKVSVRMSVGTSLLIIAFNSLAGFSEEIMQKHEVINYHFLLLFTLLSVAGIFIGFRLSLKLNATQLKKLFGWFILVMGIAIFVKEIYLPFK